MSFSIVIATLDRHQSLLEVLNCIKLQTLKPELVVIVDSSQTNDMKDQYESFIPFFNVEYIKTTIKSSAQQRNIGYKSVTSEIIAFLDDDISFKPDLFEKIIPFFKNQKTGAVSPCQIGGIIPDQGLLLKIFYFILAGKYYKSYGARLFGPGVTVYPCISQAKEELIKSDWLPATFLFMRKSLFELFKFPNFLEYSFSEDVYLTHQVSNISNIYFIPSLQFTHYSIASEFKENKKSLIRMKLRNMALVAKEVMKIKPIPLFFKTALLKIFLTISYIKERQFKNIKYIWT
jgi:glycosyltransferase involved in cell wall biosynthesis